MSEEIKKEVEEQVKETMEATEGNAVETVETGSIKEKYASICKDLVEAKKAYNLACNAWLDDQKNADLKKAKNAARKKVRALWIKKNAVWFALVAVIGTAAAIAFAKKVSETVGDDLDDIQDDSTNVED